MQAPLLRSTGAVALAAASLFGCQAGGAAGDAAATTRDSAGITIVENTSSNGSWDQGQGWTVVDSALVDIGGAATEPVYDLSQVVGAGRLSDGRLVVANASTAELRFYGPDGKHLTSVGRRGSGPGESQFIAGLWVGPADSVVIVDAQLMRLTLVGPDAKFVRHFALGGRGGVPLPTEGRVSFAFPIGLFGDGSVLGTYQTFRMNDARTGRFRDTVVYVRFGSDGAVRDTVGAFAGPETEQMKLSFGPQNFSVPTPVPLGRQTAVAASGDRFYISFNDRYEIEVRDTAGALQRLIRVAAENRPISDADVTAHRQKQLEDLEDAPGMRMVPEQMKTQMRQRVEQASYPETFPFLGDLSVDAEGNLWAQEVGSPGDEARRYAVFDSTGVLLGRTTLPSRVRPFWIGRDILVAIWTDPDDVEHLRTYPIRKP